MSDDQAILIIDDDSNNLAIVSALLEECSRSIYVAEDGETGISRARLVKPDLILLDVMMPGIDGFETCRRLKADPATRDIPVIFMTALSEMENKMKGFELGAVDYVIKPLQREEVIARVGVHLRIRHLTKELQEAKELLERRVEERTETLAQTNEELQKEIEVRKAAEAALAVKQGQLETLNRELGQRVAEEVEKNRQKDRLLFHNARLAAIGELLNNISHQWRQPLNSVALLMQGTLHDCKQGTVSPDSFSSCANRCMELISYMSKTINVFQSFFLSAGEATEFDACEVVNKSLSLVRASYAQAGIEIRFSKEGTFRLVGLEVDFSQVVVNILNNARDVLLERHPANPAVEIRCFTRNGNDIITITDNGGGVPEEILDKIFDPYFTTKFKSQGTGIGLYMAKMVIEKNMRGKLTVRNAAEGAEFTIELPAGPASEPPPASKSSPPSESSSPASGSTPPARRDRDGDGRR